MLPVHGGGQSQYLSTSIRIFSNMLFISLLCVEATYTQISKDVFFYHIPNQGTGTYSCYIVVFLQELFFNKYMIPICLISIRLKQKNKRFDGSTSKKERSTTAEISHTFGRAFCDTEIKIMNQV